MIHLRFACEATNNPAVCVNSQGGKGEIGPEGAEGDRGEIGLKGKEGPPGHPGLAGVGVSTSADSSKFNLLSTIRQLLVSIYNPLRFFFFLRQGQEGKPGKIGERGKAGEKVRRFTRFWLEHISFFRSARLHARILERTSVMNIYNLCTQCHTRLIRLKKKTVLHSLNTCSLMCFLQGFKGQQGHLGESGQAGEHGEIGSVGPKGARGTIGPVVRHPPTP